MLKKYENICKGGAIDCRDRESSGERTQFRRLISEGEWEGEEELSPFVMQARSGLVIARREERWKTHSTYWTAKECAMTPREIET